MDKSYSYGIKIASIIYILYLNLKNMGLKLTSTKHLKF